MNLIVYSAGSVPLEGAAAALVLAPACTFFRVDIVAAIFIALAISAGFFCTGGLIALQGKQHSERKTEWRVMQRVGKPITDCL